MEIKINRVFERQSVDIRVKMGEVPEKGYTVWLMPGGRIDQVPFDAEVPVYVSLPDEVYEAIVRQAMPEEKTDHIEAALTDTRDVRDRLLTLVENVVNNS